ncbi:MAG: 5'-methylthioadenosine/S-adenosylhomocysteine nucleosidase [Pseudomonadota bacterium]
MPVIAGKRVIYAMAAREEYGPELQKRFQPVMTGIGPVEAAMNMARVVDEKKPDLVVSLGSAGSAVLEQGKVYQASSVSYRDMDASPIGFEKGVTPFSGLEVDIPLPTPLEGVPTARLSTGAAIVNGPAYRRVDADMVDMETFAIKRVCMTAQTPLLALRGISDGDAELRSFADWTQYLGAIDGRLAQVVDQLEAMVASGELGL